MELPKTFIDQWTNKDVTSKIKYNQLGQTDMWVSQLSLGGAHISTNIVFNEDNTQVISGYEDVVNFIRKAIKCGINYIDTSPLYGQGKAEVVLGKALEQVPRKAYYLSTKVGRKSDQTFDYRSNWVDESIEYSMKKLGVDYIDVVSVHDVEYADMNIVLEQTLPTLNKLKDKGKIRYIGITGYPLETLKKVISLSQVKIDVVLSYCRATPIDQSLIHYIPYFKEANLGIINASLIGMGLLTNKLLIPYWHAATQQIKSKCKEAAELCQQRNVDLSRLSVYFALQISGVDTHLIGMENDEALDNNLNVIFNGISKHENQVLNEIIQLFKSLEVNHWEGIEVKRFKRNPDAFTRFLRGEKEYIDYFSKD